MSNKKKIVLIISLLVLVALLFSARYMAAGPSEAQAGPGEQSREQKPEETINQAPDFTAQDAEGNEVDLHSYFGKPIVLNFWASWCGPCRGEMPDFEQAYKEYGDEVQFLMVNLTDGSNETVESATEFIASEGYTFPLLFDTAQQAAYTYGVYSIPTTYFIDADGSITAQAKGAINAETLQKGLDMILG